MVNGVANDARERIAIVGMVGRFPGAANVEEFWRNLREGVESISFFSDEELRAAGVDARVLADPHYVKAKACLERVEWFDPWFFGLSPREAEIMDPQHRIFLEGAWEVLERAGYNTNTYQGSIGVFAGLSMNTYIMNLYANRRFRQGLNSFQAMLSNDKDHLTTRVSYKLNLRGPSVNIQTSCSTSLVAVHLASQSLLNYQCDMALAGGVSITLPLRTGFFHQEGGIVSPDGHCRPFDAGAQGTVSGNGFGVVLLKRLSEAVAEGDQILAVIKGSAINNDGAQKVGYTAPSLEGQAAVIAEAQAMAGVAADSISYVEAHGTATPLGDPIEVAALARAFSESNGGRGSNGERGWCALGSVKSNIGHLDAAAGIAGLIKTVLALRHQEMPATLHYRSANPQLELSQTPFYVNAELRPWETAEGVPRRAGVSSFGIGGTNAHVVLEEAPARGVGEAGRKRAEPLLLSAKSEEALEQATKNLAEHLEQHPELVVADVAYTLAVGRRAFGHRQVVMCEEGATASSVAAQLRGGGQRWRGESGGSLPRLVQLFPGQGAQRVGMCRELYEQEGVFRGELDRCAEVLREEMGEDLRAVLYPGVGEEAEAERKLEETRWAQPALFAVEYALARQWESWGVRGEVLLGHSVGEMVAWCLGGAWELADGLRLVARRGELMQGAGEGAMQAVGLSEAELEERLREWAKLGGGGEGAEQLSVGAVNGPQLSVVSGGVREVEGFAAELERAGVWSRRLGVRRGFHSGAMREAGAEFARAVAGVRRGEFERGVLSNVSGGWVSAAEVADASYWSRQMVERVKYWSCLQQAISGAGPVVLLEVGPGQELSRMARQAAAAAEPGRVSVVSSSGKVEAGESIEIERAAAELWVHGVEVKWEQVWAAEKRRREELPSYPFQRIPCWVEAQGRSGEVQSQPISSDRLPDMTDWFYLPTWKRTASPDLLKQGPSADHNFSWLVFTDRSTLSSQIVKELRHQGHEVITVAASKKFGKLNWYTYRIIPSQLEHYNTLLSEMKMRARPPRKILHLWGVTSNRHIHSEDRFFEKSQALGLYSLLFLAQAVGQHKIMDKLRIEVISSNVQEVTGQEFLQPEKATVLSLCKIIPQEYPNIDCRSIDIAVPKSATSRRRFIEQLIAEVTAPSPDSNNIAYRNNHRWVQSYEPVRIDEPAEAATRLRNGGVYLITGELNGLTLDLIKYVARTVRARLVLVMRSAFPERAEWPQWLATHDEHDDTSRKVARLLLLEEKGAKIIVASADVGDEEQMRDVVNRAQRLFGGINGVFHTAEFVSEESVSSVQRTRPGECEWHFRPKARGALVLDRLLRDKELDFCLLFSSLTSVLGGPGLIAHAAANEFLDAFAHKHNQANGAPWISVNLGSHHLAERLTADDQASGNNSSLTGEEAIEVVRRVLSAGGATQIAVSSVNLQGLIERARQQTSDGKAEPARTATAATQYARPSLSSAYVGPRNELERCIVEIWEELLGIQEVGIHDDFFELGGHSLVGIQLTFRLRDKLQLEELHMNSLFEKPTVAGLAEQIEEIRRTGLVMPPILVPIQPEGSNPPFFCMHPIGGDVYGLVDLARMMGKDQPFYGIQAMGLANYGEYEDYESLEQMAADYLAAIRYISPTGPYFLGGLSFGGIVAFEMAQQLRKGGEEVVLLALLDSPAPQTIAKVAHLADAIILLGLTRERARQKGVDLNVTANDFEGLNADEQLMFLLKQLKASGLAPPDLEDRWIRNFMKGYRARINTTVNYIPQLYPGRITLFRATENDTEMKDHLAKVGQDQEDPFFGWDKVSAEPIEVIPVPGYHEVIAAGPNGPVLAQQLKDCIERSWKEYLSRPKEA